MPNIDQVQLPDGSQYNLKDNISNYVTAQYVDDAIDALTKADVGLGNVDNTSDLNKPVSTAQQTALNGKTDTTVIAPTEATTTASRRYEIGEQFILNGVLYTATAVIASGDSIIVDTNCEASEDITEQIDGKADKTDLTSISESGSTASQAISVGTYFYLNGTLVRAKTDIASGATFTLNTNYGVVNGVLNDNIWTTENASVTVNRSTSQTIKTFTSKPSKVRVLCSYGTFIQWAELCLDEITSNTAQSAFTIGSTTPNYMIELVLNYTISSNILKLTYNGGSSASASVSVIKLKYMY